MNDSGCTICSGAWPRADYFIIDLGLSKVFLRDDQFFPGWTVVRRFKNPPDRHFTFVASLVQRHLREKAPAALSRTQKMSLSR